MSKTKSNRSPRRTAKAAPKTPSPKGYTIAEALAERGVRVPTPKRPEGPLPPDAIFRAAERAGVKPTIPPPRDPAVKAAEEAAHDRIVAVIGPKLVLACDQLGEEIASYREPHAGGDFSNVVDALYTIWSVRWELGLTPNAAAKAAEVDAAMDRDCAEVMAEMQREAAGEAS